jgi:hypothetical protein
MSFLGEYARPDIGSVLRSIDCRGIGLNEECMYWCKLYVILWYLRLIFIDSEFNGKLLYGNHIVLHLLCIGTCEDSRCVRVLVSALDSKIQLSSRDDLCLSMVVKCSSNDCLSRYSTVLSGQISYVDARSMFSHELDVLLKIIRRPLMLCNGRDMSVLSEDAAGRGIDLDQSLSITSIDWSDDGITKFLCKLFGKL